MMMLFTVSTLLSTASTFMIDQTSHGLWDWLGVFGSTALGIIALSGGYVALRSFVASNEVSAHAHMHLMFMHFMNARPKRGSSPAMPGTDAFETDFGGSALYFLEEVHAWTRSRTKKLDGYIYRSTNSRAKKRYNKDIVESWEGTITTQLISYREHVVPSLVGFTSCYGLDFLRFAALRLNDATLTDIVQRSDAADLNDETRILGTEEREQHRRMRILPTEQSTSFLRGSVPPYLDHV